MSDMVKIAPSILAADFARLGDEVTAVCAAGCDYVHIDVMDGHFVPNLTLGADIVAALKPYATCPLDVHLMTTPVDPLIDPFIAAGANIISFHPEAGAYPHRTAQSIRRGGVRAGIALSPGTPLATVETLLSDIDLILIMTVHPGFGGQVFIESMLSKISAARSMIDASGHDIMLEIDGGITPQTASAVRAQGADILVAGTAVFGGAVEDYAHNISALRQADGG